MNMALDDVLLQSVATGASPPILRFYRWQPAALSVGYAQSLTSGIDLAACRAAGVDVVRRPTGGRAVLHGCEVTYAVIAPCAPPFGTAVAASYRVIAGVLHAALQGLGLAVELVPGQAKGQQGRAVCFAAPAQHELLVAGCKVAGCAQKRRGGAFLQHGSIPLELDLPLLARLLPAAPGEEPEPRKRLETVGWLNRFSGRPLRIDAVEAAVATSFAAVLGVRLTGSAPTLAEQARAERLVDQYYGNAAWTRHGPGAAPADTRL